MSIQETVRSYIEAGRLLTGGLHIVALSGGADSVALLLLLRSLDYRVEAAHCNFNLRGKESMRDETFCVRLCKKLGMPLHRVHFDTRSYAKQHSVSIELAARQLRYRWFEQLRQDIGAEDICVAHHKDDNVETVLFRLIRGTGIRGLSGIRPKNGYIRRPLLCVGRRDITDYLKACKQDWVTDSTNLEREATRNRIRLDIIPQIAQINPAYADTITRTAEYLSSAGEIFSQAIEQARQRTCRPTPYGISIDTDALAQETAADYVLHEILSPYGFTPAQTAAIYKLIGEADTGRTVASPTHDLAFDRGHIIIEPKTVPFKTMRLPMDGRYPLPDGRYVIVRLLTATPDYVPSREPLRVSLDATRIAFPLTLRNTREADRMRPYGMKGSKLISDMLTDLKATVFDKRRQLVVEDKGGQIIWLVGRRAAETPKITASTKHIVEIEIAADK